MAEIELFVAMSGKVNHVGEQFAKRAYRGR
jgi:hypothetical protein